MSTSDAGGQSPPLSTAPTAVERTRSSSSDCPVCTSLGVQSDPDYLKKPCHGWPKLADVMVSHPGFQCFPAFRDLNVKSLLYYQAELDGFRKELRALEWDDHKEVNSKLCCSNFEVMLRAKEDQDGPGGEQMKLVNDMRQVLREYNEALLQYSKICELPGPDYFNIKNLYKWLQLHMMKELNIQGIGQNSWGDLERGNSEESPTLWERLGSLVRSICWPKEPDLGDLDLVVPQKIKNVDSLTRWIANEGVPFWHTLRNVFRDAREQARKETWCLFGVYFLRYSFGLVPEDDGENLPGGASDKKSNSRISILSLSAIKSTLKPLTWKKSTGSRNSYVPEEKPTLVEYSRRSMIRFTNLVATLVACLLPIVAIAVLAKMHTQPQILGFLALFTAIFAIGIMWLTDSNASRTEIFTATAAFSAVLVVFVQNQSPIS